MEEQREEAEAGEQADRDEEERAARSDEQGGGRDDEPIENPEPPDSSPEDYDEDPEGDVLDPKEVRLLVGKGRARVIDLRDAESFGQARIPGAVNVPDADPDSLPDDLDDDQRVVVVCGDGERSRELAEKLREGDRKASSLKGGMASWEDAKLPLQPSPDVD